jgi:hypothetical protein
LATAARLWQKENPMRLVTAHKILIGSAVAFFLFFAVFELRGYAASGSLADLASGVFGLAVAVGFGFYLRTVFAKARRDHST